MFIRHRSLWIGLILSLALAPAFASRASGSQDDASVRAWLRDRLGPPPSVSEFNGPPRYTLAWADLNGDGQPEAIIYVSGPGWCGSGGCGMYILQKRGSGFRLRADTSITRTPIAVLTTRTHGWRDVSVLVVGGGILPGYRAKLQFDGWKYMSNPSMAYAVKGRPPQHTVIPSSDDSRPVFDVPRRELR